MSKKDIVAAVNRFFAARSSNDAGAVLALFAPGAMIRIAGAQDASPIAATASTADEMNAMAEDLISNWLWRDYRIESCVVDDNVAVVRYMHDLTHAPSGRRFRAETLDEFHFDANLLITQMIEFVDTALVQQIEQGASAEPA